MGRGELLQRSLPLPKVFSSKICSNPGRRAVGTALVESGFGREPPFSAERGLSSKVSYLLKSMLKKQIFVNNEEKSAQIMRSERAKIVQKGENHT